jgi:hypothetical protein
MLEVNRSQTKSVMLRLEPELWELLDHYRSSRQTTWRRLFLESVYLGLVNTEPKLASLVLEQLNNARSTGRPKKEV